jgi:hypothetical protein
MAAKENALRVLAEGGTEGEIACPARAGISTAGNAVEAFVSCSSLGTVVANAGARYVNSLKVDLKRCNATPIDCGAMRCDVDHSMIVHPAGAGFAPYG